VGLPPTVLARDPAFAAPTYVQPPPIAAGNFPLVSAPAPPPAAPRQDGAPLSKSCRGYNCSKAAHGSCTNGACKFCCVVMGGCSIKDHCEGKLSAKQQAKLSSARSRLPTTSGQPALQPPLTTPFASPSLPSTSGSMQSNRYTPFPRIDSPPFADNDDLEMQLAMEESLQMSKGAGSSSLATTFTQPQPTLLSSSTPTPHHIPSTTPVTRITSKNKPSITQHLNATWGRNFEDRTQEPGRKSGAQQLDPELTRTFRVTLWTVVCSNC
jgi:hypothetical protein